MRPLGLRLRYDCTDQKCSPLSKLQGSVWSILHSFQNELLSVQLEEALRKLEVATGFEAGLFKASRQRGSSSASQWSVQKPVPEQLTGAL